MKIRFAVAPGAEEAEPAALGAMVEGLEERGFDTVWLSDVPMRPVLDPGVGLAYVAGRTKRLKLGANVVPVGRNPYRLARELAQIDRLSGGRLLLSFVPGLDQPGERETLGLGRADRGRYVDEVIPLLRRWWDGETVDYHSERFHFPGVALHPGPVQQPLEIWSGGIGPRALDRAGRLADGWLGAALIPEEAVGARQRIQSAASEAGRAIDPEHFGLSIPYARTDPGWSAYSSLRTRRPEIDPTALLPIGRRALRELVEQMVEAGLSKFVVRPVSPISSWDEELDWLSDAVLDLQT